MKGKLKKLTIDEARNVIFNEDVAHIKKTDEPFFEISDKALARKTDELIELEIALRKCERVGVFKK